MPSPAPHDLLREYAILNRRRKAEGISPLEFLRWLDLRQRLAIMANVRPIGIFVATPFAPEPGTHLDLSVLVQETGEELASPVVVVSNNVGPDFSTAQLGMGPRFDAPQSTLRSALEELYGPCADRSVE